MTPPPADHAAHHEDESGEPRAPGQHGLPRTLCVVTGTDTEVGKTWVTAALAQRLRSDGWVVAARKPILSYSPGDASTDADVLAAATGESTDVVCPDHRRYPIPMAPPMAADALGRDTVLLESVLDELAGSWPARQVDIGLVELVGGIRSPISHDADCLDMVEVLEPDLIVVVADAGLGTLNGTLLTLDALAQVEDDEPPLVVVLLNRFDAAVPLHAANRSWLLDSHAHDALVVTDVAQLSDAVEALLPTFCRGCGRPVEECDGTCLGPSDVGRHCPRCGRVATVQVTPTSHFGRCKVHGDLD
jgi:dethiobiotin synthetase